MQEQLVQSSLFSDVVLRDMPDPFGAKESEWVPFLLQKCGVDANTLIIGHSSGAEAAMRLMENNPVLVPRLLTPHTSHLNLTPHTSHRTPHTSHLTPHTSHLTPHTSHLTPHP
jgi:hypothetical protein